MKTKLLLSFLTIGLIVSAFGQKSTLELTFTADNNGQYVPLDSIFIENLTQGSDTTLCAPDTILVIDYTVGIGENGVSDENTLSVSQNYPNPFNGKTEFNLYLAEKGNIKIIGRDILGGELVQYENLLTQGNHTFSFYAGNEIYYLLTVIGKQTNQTIKMLNTGSKTTYGEKCKLVYTGKKGNASGFKSRKEINNFEFNIGDELKYTAYADLGERTIIDSPTGNQNYTFQYASGIPCPGMPTITDIDGNTYNSVLIGDQCWMKENLKTTTFRNGTPIPNVTDNNAWFALTTPAYVWYNNDINWQDSYGALYNWLTTVDTNSLCPSGWHVPNDDEWTELTGYIGGTNSPHGNELKSCRQVNSPLGGNCSTSEHPRWEEDIINGYYGTDDYGFSGLPGGARQSEGPFVSISEGGYWWSSKEYSSTIAKRCSVIFSYDGISWGGNPKSAGYSVRCVRD